MIKKIKRKPLLTVVIAAVVMLLCGCSQNPESVQETEIDEVRAETGETEIFVMKTACAFSDDSTFGKTLRWLTNDYFNRTDKRIYLKKYSNELLGTTDIVLQGLKNGRVEAALLKLSELELLIPGLDTLDAQVEATAEDEGGRDIAPRLMNVSQEQLRMALDQEGIHLLGTIWGGHRYLWSSEMIETNADLDGLRVHSSSSADVNKALEAAGCVLMDTGDVSDLEYYLDHAQLDAFVLSMDEAFLENLYLKSVCCLSIDQADVFGVFVVGNAIWEKLSEEEQSKLTACVEEAQVYFSSQYEAQYKNWMTLLEKDLVSIDRFALDIEG